MEDVQASSHDPVSLDTLGGGAAHEFFERGWEALLANVHDPNTEAETKRTLSLVFEVTPDEQRNELTVRIVPKLNRAPEKPFPARVFTVARGGEILSTDQTPKQEELFPATSASNVHPIGQRAEAGD